MPEELLVVTHASLADSDSQANGDIELGANVSGDVIDLKQLAIDAGADVSIKYLILPGGSAEAGTADVTTDGFLRNLVPNHQIIDGVEQTAPFTPLPILAQARIYQFNRDFTANLALLDQAVTQASSPTFAGVNISKSGDASLNLNNTLFATSATLIADATAVKLTAGVGTDLVLGGGGADALVLDASGNAVLSGTLTSGDSTILSGAGVDNSLTLQRGATAVLTIDGIFDGANINASQVLRLGTGGSDDLIIDASHNATFSGDLTASLILGDNGTAGAPTYSFTSDSDTGMYLVSGDTLGFAAGGNAKLIINANGMRAAANGSVTEPAWGFNNDANTGMYLAGTDTLGFTAGGVVQLTLSGTTADFQGNALVGVGNVIVSGGSASSPAVGFEFDTNTGFYRPADNLFAIVTNGGKRLEVSNTGTDFQGNALTGVGTIQLGGNLVNTVNNSSMVISGDTSASLGGNIVLDGSASGGANDIRFRSGTTSRLKWDDSSTLWSFEGNPLTNVGDITMSGGSITRDVNTSTMSIAGGSNSAAGGNIALYSGNHATNANDTILRAGSTPWLHYDDSASTVDFQDNDITTTGTVTAGDLALTNLPVHADEAAAVTAGLLPGSVYQTPTGELRIKLST